MAIIRDGVIAFAVALSLGVTWELILWLSYIPSPLR
jgi:hypothetical protein